MSSPQLSIIPIILDDVYYTLLKSVKRDDLIEKSKNFLTDTFFNKAIDHINPLPLLLWTWVIDKIPVHFRNKELPIISYEYTSIVDSILFTFHQPFQI